MMNPNMELTKIPEIKALLDLGAKITFYECPQIPPSERITYKNTLSSIVNCKYLKDYQGCIKVEMP